MLNIYLLYLNRARTIMLPLFCLCVCVCPVSQSFLIFCDPLDCSLPGSVHGIFQVRILGHIASSFSRWRPRNWTCISWISCVSRQILYWLFTDSLLQILLLLFLGKSKLLRNGCILVEVAHTLVLCNKFKSQFCHLLVAWVPHTTDSPTRLSSFLKKTL